MGNAKNKPKTDTFLMPFQVAWVKDPSVQKLMQKSRQIGISWATAYNLVRKKSLRGHQPDAWISSRDDITARLFKEDCNKFAAVLHAACKDLGQQVIDEDKNISAYVLAMANGCRIHSMSSNVDAQASKRGDRILDEFALHKNPRLLYSIAEPGVTWGGSLEIISTHRGSQNYFNQLIKEVTEGGNPKGFSLHTVTLQDALDQGFLYKLQQKLPKNHPVQAMDEAAYFDYKRARAANEETFLQEYMCQPDSDENAFIGYELIDACTMPHGTKWEEALNPSKNYYLGVDIGRKKDLTVLYLIEKEGSRLITRRLIELPKTKFAQQRETIAPYCQMPHVRRVCIDSTGIGTQLAEELHDAFGHKVEEINFTNRVKEGLAISLKRCMEDEQLRIPSNELLIADMRSIRKSTTISGMIRYEGERNANGHADRFWALALAIHAAASTQQQGFSAPVAFPRTYSTNYFSS